MASKSPLRYSQRAVAHRSPLVKRLFEIAEYKSTNLVLSADLTTTKEVLDLADKLGPYIAVLKTHIDIISDFSDATVQGLKALSEEHNFLIFEDRKFIDIASTVQKQYHNGALRISEWADIVNASVLAGEGTVEALAESARQAHDEFSSPRGVLLLAEMTSKGSLATGEYTLKSIEAAQKHASTVIGFVAQRALTDVAAEAAAAAKAATATATATVTEAVEGWSESPVGDSSPEQDDDFVIFTTGVHLDAEGDGLGQQYQTPMQAIDGGADFLTVGRGIYEADDPVETAEVYRKEGWSCYSARTW